MAPEPTRDDDAWLMALGEVARAERASAEALPASGPLRPLDAEERGGILDAVLAQRDAGGAWPVEPSVPLAEVAAPSPPRGWGRVAAALTVAAAMALAFFILRPAGPALPAYTLESTAGAQTVRGDAHAGGSVTTYGPGTRFRLVLRPAEPPAGPIEAEVILRGAAGARPWSPPIEVGARGGVKVEGVFAGPLALPPGDYTATFTVRAASGAGDGQAVDHRFRITAP